MSGEMLRSCLDRARDKIGEKFTPEGKGISDVTDFLTREWSKGLEEVAGHYFDVESAELLGLPNVRVAPSFVTLVARGPSYEMYGIPDELISLHGESEYEFLRDIQVGDHLTAEAWITEVRETESKRLGPLGIVKTDNEFRNQAGEVVVIHRHTSVIYSSAEAIARLTESDA